ncbi:uncharacterized protein N7477_007241 [Penicillium maclennaniae]|uniref:uncharacterized protein n=1 Tax=Penicillium maclennaniae TaxID=1343394 RepID=UPI00253FC3A3|nr:uncharacterized protein N7477_007241 [Penicillium maclennaniae]KAJ5664793.1 hypothetical protein N7477_007241 [Penicillium maclennaniae]
MMTDTTTTTTTRAIQPEIAFISGPIDTGGDESYFHTYYVPRIRRAVQRGDHFVIGPVPTGVDADALAYLLAFPGLGGGGAHFRAFGVYVHVVDGQMSCERDAALTQFSTYDILRVRTRKEAKAFYGKLFRDGYVTNTERNWRRRRGIAEDEIVGLAGINDLDSLTESRKPQSALQSWAAAWGCRR